MTTETRHFPNVPLLAGLLDRWMERAQKRQARKEYTALLELDDQMLRDIGVTRDEVRRFAGQPIKTGIELERNHLPF